MSTRDDMVGQKHGDWEVLAFSHSDEGGTYWYRVRCICGTERTQRGWVIRHGRSKRCASCSSKRNASIAIDKSSAELIGRTIGEWEVVAFAGMARHYKSPTTVWICRCTVCNAAVDIPRAYLRPTLTPRCRHGKFPTD